ncbi:DNA polymerase III subunit alpha [soil metagenome]
MEPFQLNFKTRDFVPLHLHTDYSLLESAIQLKPLAARLNELEIKACAMTDNGNMYGAISFYNTMKSAGIMPIIGYEAFVTFDSRFNRDLSVKAGERPYYNLVLLATSLQGYLNLAYLSSKAFTEGFFHKPRIDMDLLAEKSVGLIGISSGVKGAIGHYLQTGNEEKAFSDAKKFEDIFGKGNFYLEIQDHGTVEESDLNKKIIGLSRTTEIPLVATNDAYYLNEEDSRAHEILMCIGEGKTVNDGTRTIFGSTKFYVRSAEEMWEIFGRDCPQALRNTLEIARKCQFDLPLGENLALPDFPIPDESKCETTEEYFEQVVLEGFNFRRKTVWDEQSDKGVLKYTLENYRERIRTEVETIKNMGFPGYFLIVWDFIKVAKKKGIPVGPGRGSAAGSLVAYCLEITDVDPIRYDLLFERFLNPERVSMPDIDIDFCVRGRGEVINHVTEFYGRDSVCQIVTFGTMASKAAIKDVGRALQMPLGEVEKIAKLIPPPVRGRNISISQALEQVSDLRKAIEEDQKVRELVDLAKRLEGCSRHTSVHAAGVVISPKPLHELVPIAVSAKDELTSQYTMNDLEKVGMLKMDFLALTTLTIINDCLIRIKQKLNEEIEWSKIDLNDRKTMELFGDGRTEAIFQFESSGMQEICRRLKPKELEDLAALNALYRPGPLDGGMVDDFIARHRGDKRVQYIVPEMKEILNNTYGILVYQEQIMQLAQKLAGYSLGEADMMRRAMGKKKRSEMALHEEKFINGAIERGIKKEKAEEIFKLMAQFADYGFNRSHSVAYAYLAFQTAYLKAHYPTYFFSAVLSNESQDAAKIYKYANELRVVGLKLLPPDINESEVGFTPLEDGVRFGLSAIKGIGVASVEAIVKARRNGKFTTLLDFISKVEQGSVNRRGLESLICAGAFDTLKPDEIKINQWRAQLYHSVNGALLYGQRIWNDKFNGQSGLFGGSDASGNASVVLPKVEEWSQKEICTQEKSAIGFYLSTHPLDNYQQILSDLGIRNLADFEEIRAGENITLAGIVSALQVKHSKKGNRFCIFKLEDQSSGAKCLAWSETYTKHSNQLIDDEILVIEGRVESVDGQEVTVIINQAQKLADIVPMRSRKLEVGLPPDLCGENFLNEMVKVLSRNTGRCEVELSVELDEKVSVRINSQPLRIQGSFQLENDLKERGCHLRWVL